MRPQLHLRSDGLLSDAETKKLLGKKGKRSDAAIIAHEEVSVFKPNGTRLLTTLRGRIDPALIDAAFPFMWEMRKFTTTNRGAYVGSERIEDVGGDKAVSGMRYKPVKNDGTMSNTNYAAPVRSVVAGAMDRSPRIPYCRQTAYSTQHADKWGLAFPFIQRVAQLFQEICPERYAAQLEAAQRTHSAYVIPGTPFTTITVNNTVAGAYHTDKGDYAPGFGVIVVFRKGTYRGAELVFPKYRVGADLQHGDVIFFDPHEVHGNLPFYDGQGHEGEDWLRISMVFYFRERMLDCLEPGAELERAKQVRGAIE